MLLNENDNHSTYKGMRWLKCDLHMHTPADSRHWQGEKLIEGNEAVAAKAFAQACYESGLDVVGITDHNLSSKDFLPFLKDAFDDIEKTYDHKVTLFPGFEIEADVGKGIHVLCLFEPGTKPNVIDHILTECGVSVPRVSGNKFSKSTKRLQEILDVVQKATAVGTWRGIVIIPHVFEDSLFDNNKISEWMQQEEYCNSELLAVEIPKPVSQMSENFQKLFASGDNCLGDWKRIRPIAKLMSSDSKMLIESDEKDRPKPNSIGYRYSWIKMSKPSIESLRQAFLDNESRIILPCDVTNDIHPAYQKRLAKIKEIRINNTAFLSDQEIHFSPNLNCVIGGRGSGKSMLLEYLRLALGKDNGDDIDDGTKERINRVKNTLREKNAKLELVWESADGVEDCIIWEDNRLMVENGSLHDPKTYFTNIPVCFYSQQQLNTLTESNIGDNINQANRLLRVIDGFAKKELDELSGYENELKGKILKSFEEIRKVRNLENNLKQLKQEFQDLDRRWKAHSEIEEVANRHYQLKLESRYMDNIFGEPGNQIDNISVFAKRVIDAHKEFQLDNSPNAEWLLQFDKKVIKVKKDLLDCISQNVKEFHKRVERIKKDDPKWQIIKQELDEADKNFEKACTEKGLTVEDVGNLKEIDYLRDNKKQEVDRLENEIGDIKSKVEDPEILLNQLYEVWKNQYENRKVAASRANELASLEEGGQRLIEVTTLYQKDFNSFNEHWQRLVPRDGRTRLGRNWADLGQSIFECYISSGDLSTPWQLLQEMFTNKKLIKDPYILEYAEDLYDHICNNLERWELVRCARIQDFVDVKLYRSDGSLAGSIAEGSLSDGQRNTVSLAILLAQEGGPLVIDQPEDELDSNFVFKELIPILRKIKSSRQLIMSTHNANLPVNGDAELVYALEVKDGRGVVRANGGLDEEMVTNAVLDIMEGTEEAFRRRWEKYRF